MFELGRGGRSNTWSVDLSDVTASMVEEGEMPRLKMNAGSTPRRSSATRAQLEVEKTRINVPVPLAVARSDPSMLKVMARRGELWAGMMLTFPDSSSTSWICPCERPGNATNLAPRQHKPKALSAVSNTEILDGGEENA